MEVHRVAAALTLDRVAAIAGIPHKRVVAPTTDHHVIAAIAVDRVIASATIDRVIAIATTERVIAVIAIDRQVRQRRDPVLADDRVIAPKAVDHEALDVGGVLDRAGDAGRERRDRSAIIRDPDVVGRRRARVGRRVSSLAAVDRDLLRARCCDPGADRVVAAERVDAELILRFGARHLHQLTESRHLGVAARSADRRVIRTVGPVDDHVVG